MHIFLIVVLSVATFFVATRLCDSVIFLCITLKERRLQRQFLQLMQSIDQEFQELQQWAEEFPEHAEAVGRAFEERRAFTLLCK
jgi:hypothetical protein